MRIFLRFFIRFVLFLPWAYQAQVFARTQPIENAFDGRLRWGECRPEPTQVSEPNHEKPEESTYSLWPALCLKPRASTGMFFRDDVSDENRGMIFASGYYGLHLSKRVAFHGLHEYQRIFFLGEKKGDESAVEEHRRTKHLFFQYGNPAFDRFRLSLGKIINPFGLNRNVLPEVYAALLRSNDYWHGPAYGARLTYDTQISSSYDIAYLTDQVQSGSNHLKASQTEEPNSAVALRMMFDIAALDGFRFLFSGYGDRFQQRRISAGFLNVSRRGDETGFEWVRLFEKPFLNAEFRQNFRLYYLGAFRADSRWVFDYESERGQYRMGTIGVDFRLPDYGLFRLYGSYHHGWNHTRPNFFSIATSVAVAL